MSARVEAAAQVWQRDECRVTSDENKKDCPENG
jgi:hypothetical protein